MRKLFALLFVLITGNIIAQEESELKAHVSHTIMSLENLLPYLTMHWNMLTLTETLRG